MAYFLKKVKQKSGRVFLEVVDSIWVKRTKSSKHVVYEKIGYVDELEKTYKNPIEHFSKYVKELEATRKNCSPIPSLSPSKNLGSFIYYHLLSKLRLSNFANPINANSKAQYNIYDVFEFLTMCRIIYPSSRLESYTKHINSFFKNYSFSMSQMYDTLPLIGQNDQLILEYLNARIDRCYKRNYSHVYFDCTNFYFEIDANMYTDMKRPGPSKENHQGAIISLGLLLDADAIPLYYTLFPGNHSEKPILNNVISSMKNSCDINGKTIRVADKGLNCVENLINAHLNGDGYLYSKAIRSDDDKTMILNPIGYEEIKDDNGEVVFKSKSWTDYFEYTFNGKKYKLKEKRIVIWSKKYAEKSAYERSKAMSKVEAKSSSSVIKQSLTSKAFDTLYDVINEDNGLILSSKDVSLMLNESKLAKQEELDGYYMIITSETKLTWHEILETYRKLWEIEASFRITKSQFEGRPIYASTIDSIRGHFSSCYVALTLTRLMQKKELDNKFNAESIIKFSRELNAYPIDDNNYSLSGYSEIIPELEKRYKLHFNSRVLSLDKINKLFDF